MYNFLGFFLSLTKTMLRWHKKYALLGFLMIIFTIYIKHEKRGRKILLEHTGAKIHILSKNLHFQNRIISKIHIFEITILTKIVISKSHFSQKSLSEIIFKISFFTKVTFQKPSFPKNRIFKISFFT